MNGLVSPDLRQNIRAMRRILGPNKDVVLREFTSGLDGGRRGFLVYIGGLAEGAQTQSLYLSATTYANPPFEPPTTRRDPILAFQDAVSHLSDTRTAQKLDDAVAGVLAGEAALFLDGSAFVLLADTRYNLGRTVQEPKTEAEVRGPRDGHVEDIRTNTNLLRRRIRDPRLRIHWLVIGKRTKSDVAFAYIKGVASPKLVREVHRRLRRIQVDSIQSGNAVEELIQDNPMSPFSSLLYSERPDRITAAVLEGRVAIYTDGTPFVLIVPTSFWEYLQAPGDYYANFWVSSLFRWLRLFAMVTAFTLPSLYTLLTTFHHEMIPTPLALSIAGGREGTPLPTLIEVLGMEIMFEVIQEAGLRLPRAVGQTVSIVGALVIGEAAVMAGLVSPSTVIIIAIAGITGFAIPHYGASLSIRLLRIPLLLLSGSLGVFGFVLGTAALALHLASLRSFGAPFLEPIAPFQTPEQKDTLFRVPLWAMNRRPLLLGDKRTVRQPRGQKPAPPGGRGGGTP